MEPGWRLLLGLIAWYACEERKYHSSYISRPWTPPSHTGNSMMGSIFRVYWPFVRARTKVSDASIVVFFDMRLNKRLCKQSRRRWFETPSRSLWRHCNACSLHTDVHPPYQLCYRQKSKSERHTLWDTNMISRKGGKRTLHWLWRCFMVLSFHFYETQNFLCATVRWQRQVTRITEIFSFISEQM